MADEIREHLATTQKGQTANTIGNCMLIVLICGFVQIFQREWLNVAILSGIEAVCVMLQFGAMLLAELAGKWAGGLRDFLHS